MQEAYTISEFCKAFRISRPHFDKLRKINRGPHVLKVGQKSIITQQAVQTWLIKLEEEQYGPSVV